MSEIKAWWCSTCCTLSYKRSKTHEASVVEVMGDTPFHVAKACPDEALPIHAATDCVSRKAVAGLIRNRVSNLGDRLDRYERRLFNDLADAIERGEVP